MNNQPQFHKVVQVLFIFCSLLGNPNMEGVMDPWYSWFLTIMTTSDDRCHNLTHEWLWLVCAHYNFASTPSPILATVLCATGTTSGGTTTCTASSGYIKSPAFAVSWMSACRCQTCILKLKTCQLMKCNYSNSVEKFQELCQLAIQDIDVSIKIILAMEDFQKRQLQKGFPLSVVALCFPTREAKREGSNDIVINSSMLRSIGEEHSSKYAP